MAVRQLTEFEQVLLGMIAGEPSTGYHLKQEFATTPLGIYQPSSGALYPALRRLERAGALGGGPGRQRPEGGRAPIRLPHTKAGPRGPRRLGAAAGQPRRD